MEEAPGVEAAHMPEKWKSSLQMPAAHFLRNSQFQVNPPLAPRLNGEPPLAPRLNGDPCHREASPHPLCSERDSCGVWWSEELYQELLHLLEERAKHLELAGNRGWISHLEVELRDITISILNSPP